jgi:LacI family transcriptional regulator
LNIYKKRVTLREIAEKSGYSKTTISRVLSDSKKVKKETKEKILAIIKDLEYEPNFIARSLRTKKTHTIGLVLGDIENPFYAKVARGVIDTAERKNYSVIVSNSNYDSKLEEKSIYNLLRRQVDGILITSVKLNKIVIDAMIDIGVPFVLIDYKMNLPGINYVLNDDFSGGKIVANYLIGMGHEKIGFLGNQKLTSFKKRLDGFKSVLVQNDIKDIHYFEVSDIRDGIKINVEIRNIINKYPEITAIFSVNDYLAIKAIDYLIASGIKIPRDISIIGYDNIEICSTLRVPLTTINQPKYRMGKTATQCLLDILEKKGKKPKKIILNPEIVIRQSCIEI